MALDQFAIQRKRFLLLILLKYIVDGSKSLVYINNILKPLKENKNIMSLNKKIFIKTQKCKNYYKTFTDLTL